MQDTAKNVFPASATPWEQSFNNGNKKNQMYAFRRGERQVEKEEKVVQKKKWFRASDPTQEM